MSVETINAISNAVPCLAKVITELVSEYDGRKWSKVKEPNIIARAIYSLGDSFVKALYNQEIDKCTAEVQKCGWSKSAYNHMTSLIEQEKWKSIEFIFANASPKEPMITGSKGENGDSSNPKSLRLGLKLNSSNHHPSLFEQLSKMEQKKYNCTVIPSERYLKLIEIWLRYYPLKSLTSNCDGSETFESSFICHERYRKVLDRFIQNGLSTQNCWVQPENFGYIFTELTHHDLVIYRNHLAVSTSSEHIGFWLQSGLNPNTYVMIDDDGKRKVSWLMLTVFQRDTKGAAQLLNAGANPNQFSCRIFRHISANRMISVLTTRKDPFQLYQNGVAISVLSANNDVIKVLPLQVAREQNDNGMVALLKQYGGKSP